MKKILILEDNTAVLKYIAGIMEKLNVKTTVFPFDNTRDAYQCAIEGTIDLFIVDIILDPSYPGDSSGLRFVESIRRFSNYGFTPVIIVTNLEDEKFFAYEKLHCYSFIEKPFNEKHLKALAEEALFFPGTGNRGKTLYFRKDGIILAVERSSIVYAESINHVLHIHTNKEDVLNIPYMTIKKLLEQADSKDFIQCSRNTAINKKYIHNIDLPNRVIQFKGGMGRVEIGVRYINELKEMLR